MMNKSSVAVVRQKGHRHAGRARCTFRERIAGPRTIREQDAHRRRASRRGDDGAARTAAHFCRPREPIRVLLRLHLRLPPPCIIHLLVFVTVIVLFCFFLLCETTKATRRSRGRRRKARSRRCMGERNDSSRRRAVLPRTSHPWFPPALEPLNHSVVQRFEASVVLNVSVDGAKSRRRERRE